MHTEIFTSEMQLRNMHIRTQEVILLFHFCKRVCKLYNKNSEGILLFSNPLLDLQFIQSKSQNLHKGLRRRPYLLQSRPRLLFTSNLSIPVILVPLLNTHQVCPCLRAFSLLWPQVKMLFTGISPWYHSLPYFKSLRNGTFADLSDLFTGLLTVSRTVPDIQ